MKSAAVLTVTLALCLCVGTALADVPLGGSSLQSPAIPLPTVTLTTPTLPVPAPTLPTTSVPVPTAPMPVPTAPTTTAPLPTSTVPKPVVKPPAAPKPTSPLPTVPTSLATTQQQTSPVSVPHLSTRSTTQVAGTSSGTLLSGASGATPGAVSGPGGSTTFGVSGGSSGSPGSSTPGPSAADMPRTLDRFRPSRPWLATRGPKKHRTIVLEFRLQRRARVVFTVVQVAPVCRTIGSFSVTGHRGSNRVRFNGRMGHHRLQPGTYKIRARTLHSQMVRELVVVLVDSGDHRPRRWRLRGRGMFARWRRTTPWATEIWQRTS